MTRFGLQPLGEIEETILREMRSALEQNYPVDVFLLPSIAVDQSTYDAKRRQFNAPLLLKRLLGAAEAGQFLAVTQQDLFIPMLSFVYGQAQLKGRGALVSLARLKQEFYGLPESAVLLHERARKEAVHETGHLHGLVHCGSDACPMSLSTNIRQLDMKSHLLCPSCRALIWESGK